ncbi:GtrA family protein [Nostoc sp. TCL26-01]|uniref:GtrA family protein n=1 Tax=Nostoc sp. TCL26-01 TaxID=2576904 RepID=UPI0015BD777D|nr:GtrA family protein [Nostoc sp. TCL26-01]QLE57813.1 GtrA family protein [Nostoc sp. TCL26-01]
MKTSSKFIKYAIVGALGTFTHIGLLTLLVEILTLPPVISSSAAFIVVVIISYWLNYRWTFRSKSKHRRALLRYSIVSLFGFSLNLGIMYLIVNVLHLWYLIGQIIAIIFIPISNFFLNSRWAFKA